MRLIIELSHNSIPERSGSSNFQWTPIPQALLGTILFHFLWMGGYCSWHVALDPFFLWTNHLDKILAMVVGIVAGLILIGLTYPESFLSPTPHSLFPHLHWVLVGLYVVMPLIILMLSGTSFFEWHQILHSPDSPFTTTFYYAQIIALVSYGIFYLMLAKTTPNEMPYPVPSPSHKTRSNHESA